jgi:hypothetical protein
MTTKSTNKSGEGGAKKGKEGAPPQGGTNYLLGQSEAATKHLTDAWNKHLARWSGLAEDAQNQKLDAKKATAAFTECTDQIMRDSMNLMAIWMPGGGPPKAPSSSGEHVESFDVEASEEVNVVAAGCFNVRDKAMTPPLPVISPATIKAGTHRVKATIDISDCINGMYHLDYELQPVTGADVEKRSHLFYLDVHPVT